MENPGSSRSRLWLQLINWHAILHLSDDNLDFLFREGWSSRIRGQLANGGISSLSSSAVRGHRTGTHHLVGHVAFTKCCPGKIAKCKPRAQVKGAGGF